MTLSKMHEYFADAPISSISLQPSNNFDREKYFCFSSYNCNSNFLSFCKLNNISEVYKHNITNNIIKLKFLDTQIILTCDSKSISQYKLTDQFQLISNFDIFTNIYDSKNDAITNFDIFNNNLILTSLKGIVFQIDINNNSILQNSKISSCILNTVAILNKNDDKNFIVGNNVGQIHLIDLLSPKMDTKKSYRLKFHNSAVTSLVVNPLDSNNFLAGFSDGGIQIWDIRREDLPISKLYLRKSSINQMMFDPQCNSSLYVCGGDGFLTLFDPAKDKSKIENIWSKISAYEHEMVIETVVDYQPLSINCFDKSDNDIICGGDMNHILYVNVN